METIMRINSPLDKILSSEIKVRTLRVFCRMGTDVSGRQMAKMIGVTPKTAHEVLQSLLKEGVLTMRSIGRTYLFSLNGDRLVVKDVLKPLFTAEEALIECLSDSISRRIKKSLLKSDILSVALFGSVQTKTERETSDIDLMVVVRTAAVKKKVEDLFSDIDQQLSSSWGNLISPYINSLAEFKSKSKKKVAVIQNILKSYRLIYGVRLERLLR